jgi:hypothetical protein
LYKCLVTTRKVTPRSTGSPWLGAVPRRAEAERQTPRLSNSTATEGSYVEPRHDLVHVRTRCINTYLRDSQVHQRRAMPRQTAVVVSVGALTCSITEPTYALIGTLIYVADPSRHSGRSAATSASSPVFAQVRRVTSLSCWIAASAAAPARRCFGAITAVAAVETLSSCPLQPTLNLCAQLMRE